MAEKAGDVYVNIGAKFNELDKKLTQINDKIDSSFKKTSKNVSSSFDGIKTAIVGAFSVQAVISFQKQIIQTTAEFQKLEAVLTNTLGSKTGAKLAFAEITDFAAKTPFSVLELTDSFVKLANQGFKPSIEQMRNLGDLASSTGKTFNQLAEAIIDAQVGEFERLKEFGVRATKEGENVIFTFKGVKTEVDFTAEAIQNYLVGLGDLEGVSGSMAAVSETLGGKINNLGDAYDNLLKTIGGKQTGVLYEAIDGLNTLFHATNRLMTTPAMEGEQMGLKVFQSVAKEGRSSALVVEDLGLKLAGATADLAELKKQEKELQDDRWARNRVTRLMELGQEIAKAEAYMKTLEQATTDYLQTLADEALKKKEKELAAKAKAAEELAVKIKAAKEAQAEYDKRLKDESIPLMLAQRDVMQQMFGGQKIIDITPDINIDPQPVQDFRDEILAADEDFQNFLQNSVTNVAKMKEQAEMLQFAAMGISSAFQSLGNILIDSFGEAETAGGKFAQAMGRIVVNIISQALAASLAKSVQIATNTGAAAGPAGPVVFAATLGSMGAMVNAAFSSIPAFAKGGQSRGGMALVGERGPELVSLAKGAMVTPHHQMRGALNSRQMAMTVNVVGSLKGQDIYLSGSRGQTNLNR